MEFEAEVEWCVWVYEAVYDWRSDVVWEVYAGGEGESKRFCGNKVDLRKESRKFRLFCRLHFE